MRDRRGRWALLLLAAALTAGVATASAEEVAEAPSAADGADRDGPLPRLERVGPLDGGPDGEALPDEGTLQLSPAVTEIVVPVDRRVAVTHVVANGTDARLAVEVDVVASEAGEDGPTPGVMGPVPPDAAVRLVAPVERLQLDPGEGALLHSVAQADAGEAGLFSLRVRTADGTTAVSRVVVAEEGTPAGTALALDVDGLGQTTVELAAERPTVVDVRVRARSWAGTTTDRTLADVVVGPAGRSLELERPASRWPGPVHAVAVAVGADAEIRAEASGTTVPPVTGAVVGGMLVLLVAVALWWRVRRRHALPTAGSP
jgi:hypothetical protein